MNTKAGKGFFYSMGARDRAIHSSGIPITHMLRYRKAAAWPEWAQDAYQHGFKGWHNW